MARETQINGHVHEIECEKDGDLYDCEVTPWMAGGHSGAHVDVEDFTLVGPLEEMNTEDGGEHIKIELGYEGDCSVKRDTPTSYSEIYGKGTLVCTPNENQISYGTGVVTQ